MTMKSSNFNITEQLYIWDLMTMRRYARLCNFPNVLSTAYLNHPLNWSCKSKASKVIVHAASEKLVNVNAYFTPLTLGFACVGGQSPSTIKSKKSVAAFKLVKNSFMGGLSSLRRKHLLQFQYKFSWISPNSCSNLNGRSIGIKYLVFPELDLIDYYAFETLQGFELHFITKPFRLNH